jgi:hypothetical protein
MGISSPEASSTEAELGKQEEDPVEPVALPELGDVELPDDLGAGEEPDDWSDPAEEAVSPPLFDEESSAQLCGLMAPRADSDV